MTRCPSCGLETSPLVRACEHCGASLPVGPAAAPDGLVRAVRSLLADGQKIEAIKAYREATGAGLKEAKDAVEALEAGRPITAPGFDAAAREEVVTLLREGRTIDAIKAFRAATGAGLKEAKDAVEALQTDASLDVPGFHAPEEARLVALLQEGRKIEAIKAFRDATGVGLKEAKDAVEAVAARHGVVAPAGSGTGWLVVAAAAVFLAAVAWVVMR